MVVGVVSGTAIEQKRVAGRGNLDPSQLPNLADQVSLALPTEIMGAGAGDHQNAKASRLNVGGSGKGAPSAALSLKLGLLSNLSVWPGLFQALAVTRYQ